MHFCRNTNDEWATLWKTDHNLEMINCIVKVNPSQLFTHFCMMISKSNIKKLSEVSVRFMKKTLHLSLLYILKVFVLENCLAISGTLVEVLNNKVIIYYSLSMFCILSFIFAFTDPCSNN